MNGYRIENNALWFSAREVVPQRFPCRAHPPFYLAPVACGEGAVRAVAVAHVQVGGEMHCRGQLYVSVGIQARFILAAPAG